MQMNWLNSMTLYTLQFLRFLASLLVLLFHLELVHSGYKGVDIFFVISGFVMYYTLFFKSRPNAFKFFVHRFTKIFFLYWVALILLFLVQPFKFDKYIVKTILLIPGHHSLLGVSWSLSYELYFYFLIGTFVYLLADKYHKLVFLTLFLISTLVTFINLSAFTLKGSMVNFLVGANFWEFLLGIGCAYLATTYYKLIGSSTAVFAALLGISILLATSIQYDTPVSYIVYGVLSSLVVFFFTAYEQGRAVNRRLALLSKVLGDASYAIYLFGPIITLLVGQTNNTSKIIIIVATIGSSIYFNRLVENNFMDWTRKILLRRPTRYKIPLPVTQLDFKK